MAAGKIAFQSGTRQGEVWSLPADTNKGRVTGAMERVTSERADYSYASLTPDGKFMTFSSDRTGSRNDVFLRDMTSGQERAIAAEDPDKSKAYSLINSSGTEVVYTMSDANAPNYVYVVPVQGGAKRKICDCGPSSSLSPDGTQFLSSFRDNTQPMINLVDIASGKSTVVLEHPKYPLSRPRFSPDGKWIVFLVTHSAGSLEVMLAPFRGAARVSEQDWITVTPALANVNQAFWSPDGGLLYYVINAGGSYSLIARRLDRNRHPTDPPFRVFEFNGRLRPQAIEVYSAGDAITAVPGRFIGAMPEMSFNVWIMDLPK